MIRRVAARYSYAEIMARQAETAPAIEEHTVDLPRLTATDIRETLETAFPARMTIRYIQDEVAQFYGIKPDYLRQPDRLGSREPRISHPRQMAMVLSREFTKFSLPDIGRHFGGRDHTTVLYALKAVQKRAKADPYVDLELEVLRERFAA